MSGFWQRVDIEQSTETQTSTGNPRLSWSSYATEVAARVLPLEVTEDQEDWATPQEDAYEVQLRGAWPDIRPRMRVVVEGADYDIRKIRTPPPFGDPSTVLLTVRITP